MQQVGYQIPPLLNLIVKPWVTYYKCILVMYLILHCCNINYIIITATALPFKDIWENITTQYIFRVYLYVLCIVLTVYSHLVFFTPKEQRRKKCFLGEYHYGNSQRSQPEAFCPTVAQNLRICCQDPGRHLQYQLFLQLRALFEQYC